MSSSTPASPFPARAPADSPDAAARAAEELGAVMVKARVPAGRRGHAGGVRAADTPAAARIAAADILGMEIAGYPVSGLLVEERIAITRELYAAVLNDPALRRPMVLFSSEGGVDVEDVAAVSPGTVRRHPVDMLVGFDAEQARGLVQGLDLGATGDAVADVLVALYRAYRDTDAELLEINPLAVTRAGRVVALDCKLVLDDAGAARRPELAAGAVPERLTALEARARELGLSFVELDGDVGVLANGAGLTMTTMDVVRHHGGRAANFLEIGGEAYTRAEPALELLLANPRVRSLVVNFCGAFARTDVMTAGVVEAWQALSPEVPVFFSIHGTGDREAVALLRDRLGMKPAPDMDAACRAAVEAAANGTGVGR